MAIQYTPEYLKTDPVQKKEIVDRLKKEVQKIEKPKESVNVAPIEKPKRPEPPKMERETEVGLAFPKTGGRKQAISIHLSPEVIEFFKATGRDWHPRIDRVLLDYVRSQNRG